MLWNPNAASSWSFLFTPAFGAWLHAANWRALGRPGKARMSMVRVWLTAAFLAAGLVLPFLPGLERENGWMGGIGLLLFLVWYFTQGGRGTPNTSGNTSETTILGAVGHY